MEDTRAIISFCELSEEWQAVALDNLDDSAEDASYIEPLESHVPNTDILWDLEEAMPSDTHPSGCNGTESAVIPISNNSAMRITTDDYWQSVTMEAL